MVEPTVTLDTETYQALQQELLTLRQQVLRLQQDKLTAPFQVARQRTVFNVIGSIRASLDLEVIFQKTATEVRQLLNADRVGMFRFHPDSNYTEGEFVSEDVLPGYDSAIATPVHDRCFGERYASCYQQGQLQAIADIDTADLSNCHRELLSRFQIKANLVVPLLLGDQLWGLLCIHQCSQPRQWQDEEIEFVNQIAVHLGVALQQAELLAKTKQQAIQLARLNHTLEEMLEEQVTEAIKVNQALKAEIASRQKADRALAVQTARIEDIAAHLPGAIFQFANRDGVWRVDYISDGIWDLAGITAREMMQDLNRFIELVHPEDLSGYIASIEEALENAAPWYYEGRLIQPNGEMRWWQGESTPTLNEYGEINFCGVLLDISGRKQAEEALRQLNEQLEARVEERTAALQESEKRLHTVTASAPLILFAIDGQGQFTFSEGKELERLGYKPGELVGKSVDDLCQNQPEILAGIQQGLAGIASESVTCFAGRFFENRFSPIQNEAGNVVSLIGVSLDITDRRQAELERDRFFNLSSDLLCIVDFEGYFKRINPAFEVILGYSTEELLSKPFLEFVHPDDRGVTSDVFAQLRQGISNILLENRYLCPDGSYKWLSWNGVPSESDRLIYAIARDISGRKQAEVALQRSEQRFRCLVEATSQIIWHTTAEGQFVSEQPEWSAFTGQSFEELKGAGWIEAVHPDDRAQTIQTWSVALRNQTLYEFEHRLRRYDGEYRYMGVRAVPVLEADGSIRDWIGIHTDISDRKAAQEQLLETKNLYQQILDAIPDLILCKGSYSRIIYGNQAFRNYYGMTAEQLQGLIDAPFVNPDYTLQYIRDDAHVFTTGKTLIIEEPIVRYDSEVRLFSTVKTAIFDSQGQVVQTVGISRDITEDKQAEAALQQQAQIINQVHDGIVATDLQGSITSWSQGAERLYGYTAQEVIGQPISVLYEPDQSELMQAQILKLLYEKGTHEMEVKIRRKSGEDLYLMLGLSVLRDLEGNAIGMVSSAMNISDRKQVEIRLQQQAEDLEKALRQLQQTQTHLVQSEKMSSLGQLVAGIAHEINNPVNFIYGNLIHVDEYAKNLLAVIETYQQCYPNPVLEVQDIIEDVDLEFLIQDLPKMLTSMQVGAERIREIVTSLRNFSRLDEADCKEVNIHDGIDSTLMILHNRLKAKSDSPGIQVMKNYGNLPLVECYPGQLNQVFMNIIANAIDALEERDKGRSFENIKKNPSWITITTEVVPSEKKVRIQISDNGLGIPEAVKNRIFDPFFTTKPLGKGTGLGMAISYQIVTEKHQGTLDCFSEPGTGANFVIHLPIYQGLT
ncbi:MAG: PAS domain S-box protein [Actinomycetota bacterium]